MFFFFKSTHTHALTHAPFKWKQIYLKTELENKTEYLSNFKQIQLLVASLKLF